MIKQLKWAWAIAALTLLAGIVTLFYVDGSTELPIKWTVGEEIDNGTSAWISFLTLPFLQFILLALFSSLKILEPRQQNLKNSTKALLAIALSMTCVLLIVQATFISMSMGYEVLDDSAILVGLGLMFLVTGNYLGKLRSSFFIGIRTPWTLSSDEVWQRTHRLAGRLFMVAGLVMIVASLALHSRHLPLIATAVLLPAVIIPVVYSWLLWRAEQQKTKKPEQE
ncbi:MAG: hypothetical protein COB37_08375 [Kordiimonadales bacterium]|nr:MAG: hypothetical protein COB37_08375 [Kordiimonadales bacterium]